MTAPHVRQSEQIEKEERRAVASSQFPLRSQPSVKPQGHSRRFHSLDTNVHPDRPEGLRPKLYNLACQYRKETFVLTYIILEVRQLFLRVTWFGTHKVFSSAVHIIALISNCSPTRSVMSQSKQLSDRERAEL